MPGIFLRRLVGAAMLDANTYEEIEADRKATPQAFAVVVLSSVAAGIGLHGAGGADATLSFTVIVSLLAVAAWATFAAITFGIGSRTLATGQTRVDLQEMLRTVGFAAAPGLLQVFAALTPAPVVVAVLVFAWTMVASVVAVRQALDFDSTSRALAVCLVGWGLPLAIAVSLATAVSGLW